MTLIAKQIYQQNILAVPIDSGSAVFAIDMIDPAGSGKYLTYKVTASQIASLLGCKCILESKVTLTSAQILALNSVPQQIVPAPGAGLIIQPVSFLFAYNYNSAAYATNKTLIIYNNASQSLEYFLNDTLLAQTSSSTAVTVASVGGTQIINSPISSVENQPLMIYVQTGNPTGGDATLTIYTTYTIVTA